MNRQMQMLADDQKVMATTVLAGGLERREST
jgi:hypothetical protein